MAKRFRDCFECGRRGNHSHHVVPRSMGGTKQVDLCRECHSLAHMGPNPTKYVLSAASSLRYALRESSRNPGTQELLQSNAALKDEIARLKAERDEAERQLQELVQTTSSVASVATLLVKQRMKKTRDHAG